MSQAKKKKLDEKQSLQLVGLLLWRAGLLLAASSGLYHTIEFGLRFIDLPRQLEIGLGLVVAGAVLVLGSFVMERFVDYRAEGDLSK